MSLPERTLNLEAEGRQKYNELRDHILEQTQTKKKPTQSVGAGPSTGTPKSFAKTEGKPQPPKVTTAKAAQAKKAAGSSGTTSKFPQTINLTANSPTSTSPHSFSASFHIQLGGHSLEVPITPDATKGKGPSVPRSNFPPKPTAATASSSASRKRAYSPEIVELASAPQKRAKPSNDAGFEWIEGIYLLSSPSLTERLNVPDDGLELTVRMDSANELFGAFKLHLINGVVRSSADVEPRADGASGKVVWCGHSGLFNPSSDVYPPRESMRGVLRFTQRKRDGKHTLKGNLEDVPDIGKLEFTGERISEGQPVQHLWEDFADMSVDGSQLA
ncbi:SubName: Full=Uncharacterized protein {ECO:0000313/EMBL:CCA68713.1} [Serendipita indica DSM 11827]|nr:SubName: Full=Uncharacterized protein {ECO:0000313/EMBL:CCA68713.1} [Serendipita indica DSM 11827]